jgi:hypothetical protein
VVRDPLAGRYPRWGFDYIVGVLRWHNRVVGYAFLLVTDQYPPSTSTDALPDTSSNGSRWAFIAHELIS